MEDWRIYALSFFPDLGPQLIDEDFYNYYQLFFDLLPMYRDLLPTGEWLPLRKIHAFSRWCLFHEDKDIANAAAVAFYEHLFDRREEWELVEPFIEADDQVLRECWPLWAARKSPEEQAELWALLRMDDVPATDDE